MFVLAYRQTCKGAVAMLMWVWKLSYKGRVCAYIGVVPVWRVGILVFILLGNLFWKSGQVVVYLFWYYMAPVCNTSCQQNDRFITHLVL